MKKKIAFYPTPFKLVNFIINLTSLNNKKILDTGFGEGIFLEQLNQKSKNSLIYGVEIDRDFYQKQFKKRLNNYLINDDYLNYEPNFKFDLIIGNPPYITLDNLHIDLKNKIKELTQTGEANIYYAFILKSIQLLKENGELIYILPIDFFTNTYAKYLREEMCKNGYFEYIFNLGETKIFKNANVETIIFKYLKTKNINKNQKTKIFQINKLLKYDLILDYLIDSYDKNQSNNYFSFYEINIFKNHNWYLREKDNLNTYIKFNELFNIYVGIVNGCEKCFNVNKDFNKRINDNEKKLLSKFIKNKNSKNNYIIDYQYYLFLDDYINNEKDLDQYPNIKKYLLKNKNILNNRYIQKNKKWFNYLAIRNKKIMDNNINELKIVVPCITRKKDKWFSITNQNVYIAGDLLLLIPKIKKDIYFLFAYLNSKKFTDYYMKYGIIKGNRINFKQGYLNNFEIPKINVSNKNKITEIVKNMIKNNDNNFEKLEYLF